MLCITVLKKNQSVSRIKLCFLLFLALVCVIEKIRHPTYQCSIVRCYCSSWQTIVEGDGGKLAKHGKTGNNVCQIATTMKLRTRTDNWLVLVLRSVLCRCRILINQNNLYEDHFLNFGVSLNIMNLCFTEGK